MIDTITLSLNIRDPANKVHFDAGRTYEWSPNIGHIIAGGRSTTHGRKIICHYRPPLEEEQQSGEYYPSVKLLEVVRRGGIQQYLYITFSAPKLVFGNNFNELENRHLMWVCLHLAQRLKLMGISVPPKVLRQANVSQIHYSKNIILKNQPISEVFGILRKAQPSRYKNYRYERYSSYTGGGQSVYIYTKTHGLCFYDKKAESRRNRGISNDQYADAWQLPKSTNVLRIESRCNTPANIRKTLTWAELSTPSLLTLDVLFNSHISQTILLKEFETFRTYLPPLTHTGSLSDIIKSIKTYNPTLTPAQVINASLLIRLLHELSNEQDVRNLLDYSPSTWCRRKELLNSLTLRPLKKKAILTKIERQLKRFIPIYYNGKNPL